MKRRAGFGCKGRVRERTALRQKALKKWIAETARKAALPGWQAAGKTGTSQEFRDVWFIGYTSHLVAGVWLGNDDNSPTKKASGGNLPVEIWSRFMRAAHQGVPPQPLPGGFWHDYSPRPVPMAENNGWPSLPRDLPTPVNEEAQAPPGPIHGGATSGAPVPPADIPNASPASQPHHAPSGKQNFLDTLFGG